MSHSNITLTLCTMRQKQAWFHLQCSNMCSYDPAHSSMLHLLQLSATKSIVWPQLLQKSMEPRQNHLVLSSLHSLLDVNLERNGISLLRYHKQSLVSCWCHFWANPLKKSWSREVGSPTALKETQEYPSPLMVPVSHHNGHYIGILIVKT